MFLATRGSACLGFRVQRRFTPASCRCFSSSAAVVDEPVVKPASFTIQEIPTDVVGDRVDKFLSARLGVPFSVSQKMLRTGRVRLHDGSKGHKIEGSYKLQMGDKLSVPMGADIAVAAEGAGRTKKTVYLSDAEAAEFRKRVLFMNEHVLILNKPAGLATQGGPKLTAHVDGMLECLKFESKEVPRLVHRLDKDVAGCLVLARTREAAVSLGGNLAKREGDRLSKVYWAALSARPQTPEGRIKMSLSKDAIRVMGSLKIVPTEDPSMRVSAVTEYLEIDHAGKSSAFVELYPETGRKHQIRVHCAEALRAPIIGDEKYGSGLGVAAHLVPAFNESIGLQLFSRSITLPYPDGDGKFERVDGGSRVRIVAPLPDHMVPVWKYFGWNQNHRSD
ncbi:mitochondrial pseudouridine synthase [Andalucia godoyi]|uniref:Mitochondrial pseudouridine synthase n=1 Tax=Andalucia godoyi TaxID=505711 RepID=A0A8K0AIB7_ANDGO|nr:mitochondrial pseudouridine synthase [Andalucia godoyi]|eukprot:ANDGO_02592.mRNA.1 mitochondrial pseudouridine synthase